MKIVSAFLYLKEKPAKEAENLAGLPLWLILSKMIAVSNAAPR